METGTAMERGGDLGIESSKEREKIEQEIEIEIVAQIERRSGRMEFQRHDPMFRHSGWRATLTSETRSKTVTVSGQE